MKVMLTNSISYHSGDLMNGESTKNHYRIAFNTSSSSTIKTQIAELAEASVVRDTKTWYFVSHQSICDPTILGSVYSNGGEVWNFPDCSCYIAEGEATILNNGGRFEYALWFPGDGDNVRNYADTYGWSSICLGDDYCCSVTPILEEDFMEDSIIDDEERLQIYDAAEHLSTLFYWRQKIKEYLEAKNVFDQISWTGDYDVITKEQIMDDIATWLG